MRYILIQDVDDEDRYALLDIKAEAWITIDDVNTTWTSSIETLFNHIQSNSSYFFKQDLEDESSYTKEAYLNYLFTGIFGISKVCEFDYTSYDQFIQEYPEYII